MSLILDALRRADSERERGAVPGLHAQQVPVVSTEAAPRPRFSAWHWIALGITSAILVALASYIVAREAAPPMAGTAARPLPTPSVTAAASAAPPASVTPPAAAAVTTNPAQLQQVAEPARWPINEHRKAEEKPVSAAPATVPANEKPAPPFNAAPAEPPVYTREQLPENIRAELPQLAVGGAIYSTDAASRSVIINGRIYRENDRLTTDLTLEQIKLKAAVLLYKGYRFEIRF